MPAKVEGLNLKINTVPLYKNEADIRTTECKFLIKPDVIDANRDPGAKLSDNLSNPIAADRFKLEFLKHIATLQTSAGNGGWSDATNDEMVAFLKKNATTSLDATNIRNFVVSVQVVLIDADKTTELEDGSKPYVANDVAIIQFPLYRSNPDSATAFGGRRRTKAFKGKSSYRTRKHKK
jgi:hypothetical protein